MTFAGADAKLNSVQFFHVDNVPAVRCPRERFKLPEANTGCYWTISGHGNRFIRDRWCGYCAGVLHCEVPASNPIATLGVIEYVPTDGVNTVGQRGRVYVEKADCAVAVRRAGEQICDVAAVIVTGCPTATPSTITLIVEPSVGIT